MRILLDSHLLLWAAADARRLSADARDAIEDEENDVYFSAASMWEIAIKGALGRRDFRIDLSLLRQTLPERGFHELPVTADHAVAVSDLPPIHRDPFDRLLVAQSIVEPMVLMTNDVLLRKYGPTIRVA